MKVALRVVATAFAAQFMLLLGTGLWLVWNYRPTEAAGWADVPQLEGSVRWGERVRFVHHFTSSTLLVTAFVLGVLTVIQATRTRRWWAVPRGVVTPIVGFTAGFSGFLIAWDQLALWSVTVGANMSGFTPLFDGHVRYALIGDKEISLHTLQLWFWTHTVFVPALLALLVAIALFRAWRPAIPSRAERDADVRETEPWH